MKFSLAFLEKIISFVFLFPAIVHTALKEKLYKSPTCSPEATNRVGVLQNLLDPTPDPKFVGTMSYPFSQFIEV